MNKTKTDESSGTEVIINIKEGDTEKFKKALKRQLKYFENIKYVNCGIDNDYQIIKGKHFIHRLNKNASKWDDDKDLHLCLGKVNYPIDNHAVGRWTMNVGLYFDIGEIPVVWNRESVEYTDKAISKIKEKVKLARKELQELYDQQYEDIDSIEKLFEFDDLKEVVPLIKEENEDGETATHGIYIRGNFIDTQASYPKYKYLRVKPKEKRLFSLIRVDRAFSTYSNYTSTGLYNFNPINDNVYIMGRGENYSEIKTEFLKQEDGEGKFIRFNNEKNAIRSYLDHFHSRDFARYPYDIPKQERQEAIKEAYQLYDEVKEFILNNSKKFADVEVTDDFKEEFLAEKEAERRRKEEIFHFLRVQITDSFNRNRINGNTLKKKFGDETVIYGFQDDREALREVKRILRNELGYRSSEYIHVIQISMKNERVVKEVLGDQACYVHKVERLSVIRKISNKYNKKAYINNLINHGIRLKVLNNTSIPKYIDPEEPTQKEKMEVWKKIGEHIKYPLLEHLQSYTPEKLKQEYKELCEHHHINPILIGKKYIKENYEEDSSTQEQQ